MRFISLVVLFVALTPISTFGETSSSSAQRADDLRSQLSEMQSKEAELQARLRQIDDDIKPENIARSLAGFGSTRPEELREHRRRQLEIERQGVIRQLNLVVVNRERLQSALTVAEAEAYQKSAEATSPVTQTFKSNSGASTWRIGAVGAAIAVLGFFAIVAVRKYSPR
jgi:hypothetical protein